MNNIKTDEGLGTPMPATDLQENNKRLKALEKQQLLANIRGYLWFALVVVLLLYIKFNNILNNYIAACV